MVRKPSNNPPKFPDFDAYPLFYEALSGEFQPPGDPLKRTHTLGRLSIAAYQRGEATDMPTGLMLPNFIHGPEAYRYTPSWAPSVEATTVVDALPFGPLLKGLVLSSHDSDALAFFNDRDAERQRGLRFQVGDQASFMALRLDDIDEVKTTVTLAAQMFFEAYE
jgi:hypothetical protein